MKRIIALITVFYFVVVNIVSLAFLSSCSDDITEYYSVPGVIPKSIDSVVDVIEVQFGKTYNYNYLGREIAIEVVDFEDHLQPFETSSTAYYDQKAVEEMMKNNYIEVFLKATIDNKSYDISIRPYNNSPSFTYRNDGEDIADIQNIMTGWHNLDPEIYGRDWFYTSFKNSFTPGVILPNTELSFFLGKVYSFKDHGSTDKNIYKFVFIFSKHLFFSYPS
ncbi:MAG: hypothetical protein LBR13_00335 [Dysgonamonadaceae bacterium]|jgi:hypothetical protein|nr:hypothetical protein [Dysgonamonadaceae bacterium]